MKLLRKSDGEWFKHPQGAEFRIRPIPAGKAREIDLLIHGHKREIVLARGKRSMVFDTEKGLESSRAKADYALVDSRDCQIDAFDEASALVLSKASGRAVNIGDEVTLDGHWTPEVKGLVFDAAPAIVDWTLSKAATFDFKAEEEEGKD